MRFGENEVAGEECHPGDMRGRRRDYAFVWQRRVALSGSVARATALEEDVERGARARLSRRIIGDVKRRQKRLVGG